ncbi:MAG: hypothetical protein HC913_15090 [Microscillaceae bacterium]|nr:hypothetical protein [Microscillaceae bacterium]
MRRFLLVLLLLAIAAPGAEAQIGDLRKKMEDALGKDDKKKKKPEKKDVQRFFPGYNFSFRFGNPFRFFLYPNFEYHFSDKFRVGLVGQFQYHSENYEGALGETKIREPYLGGNFFLQYQIGRFSGFGSNPRACMAATLITIPNYLTDSGSLTHSLEEGCLCPFGKSGVFNS